MATNSPRASAPVSAQLATDRQWMALALAQAQQALYSASPNPRVGCVVVQNGQLVAKGFTQVTGQAHAEIMALRQAHEQQISLEGATVYVTLEPCSHYGRTPPCVDALIQERPARVVIAMLDPNPQVAGQGVARLQAEGIEVVTGVCQEQALALNPGFVSRMVRKRPWVWLKVAASLDGGTALLNGQSQWITDSAARADGHHWRARSCVVLSGSGTVLADNPLLTVRDVPTERQPIRAVIDSRLQISPNARLFNGDEVWVFTCRHNELHAEALRQKNARLIVLPASNGQVNLHALFNFLADHEINEVHVEAGAALNGVLVEQGLADELLTYLAPMLLCPAKPMFHLPELSQLSAAAHFEFIDALPLGNDIRLLARNSNSWEALKKHV